VKPLSPWRAVLAGAAMLAFNALHADTMAAAADTAGGAAAPARVEAKSKTFMAVGLLEGDRLTIHLSRVIDNAPVHDAAVRINIRALDLPAVAQTNGSYEARSAEFKADGPAVVAFVVKQGEVTEKLVGTLEVPPAAKSTLTDNGQVRQLLWWVLNFAVCIGFLVLYSRRRKAAEARGED
jgi:hypothetical protein